MKLYLMQHGRAFAKEEDPERPLTGEGIVDVKKMAEFLDKSGVRVSRVLHSGKTRARQTAEIIMSRLNPGKKPVEQRGILPLDDVKDCAEEVNKLEEDIMIIGHLPHLDRLASILVVGSESISVVAFQQGGVVCLSRSNDLHWSISWMVIPDII